MTNLTEQLMNNSTTKPPANEPQVRLVPYLSLLAIAALTVLATSCAVVLVGPYDEVTDKAISDLETKTEQFLAKMESTKGGYDGNKSFYDDARASIRAIRLRAELYGTDKNKGELDDIDKLQQAFDQLAELHQTGALAGRAGTTARSLIETNFQALLQIELAK